MEHSESVRVYTNKLIFRKYEAREEAEKQKSNDQSRGQQKSNIILLKFFSSPGAFKVTHSHKSKHNKVQFVCKSPTCLVSIAKVEKTPVMGELSVCIFCLAAC